MPIVAYITNQFPSSVEPYVVEEIGELRARGVVVIPCSARRVEEEIQDHGLKLLVAETLYLQPLQIGLLVRAAWLCLRKFTLLADLFERVVTQGRESPARRMRALIHTWLGAYYALRLHGRGVHHIHVHHGYFTSWVAMIAARLLGTSFSITLHGSDLLLHRVYLDTKLKNCKFCLTVSEFNRRHILEHYPGVERDKIIVRRLGVDPLCGALVHDSLALPEPRSAGSCFIMLAAGRLHPVKDHAFLVRACEELRERGLHFFCLIAGEGPERPFLERLIRDSGLRGCVKLLGHLPREQLNTYYDLCDLVVLTSRSEGIPLVLMEAMAHGRTVLAPAITGIPELVVDGRTGFLYRAGSLEDFVARVETIRSSHSALGPLRRRAHQHVLRHFNRDKNLAAFGDFFLNHINATGERDSHEDSILQQI